jgi:hypothetical protein
MDSNNSYKADSTQTSFVFGVRNSRDSKGRKFTISNLQYAIYCNSSHGPTFGCHSIYIAANFNCHTTSYTSLGNVYVNNTDIHGQQFFTGEYNFTVKAIAKLFYFAIFRYVESISVMTDFQFESESDHIVILAELIRLGHCMNQRRLTRSTDNSPRH